MTHDNLADIELVHRCRDGDEQAFQDLYDSCRRPLFSYLNKLLPGQAALVDDLFQETWIRVLENLDGYKDRQRFSAWLFRIAHNLAVDHFRRASKQELVPIDDRITAPADMPWETLDRAELDAALERALAGLGTEQQEVVLLRRQGMPFREIAGLQGVSINTVLGRMHYAVRNLQRLLAEWAGRGAGTAGAEATR